MSSVDGLRSNFDRPLNVGVLIKQVPVGESLRLGKDGRLIRDGLALEMNAFCRRAVSKGVEWAGASGGSCTVFTLGPPAAEDVLREAVAWGADRAIRLCDRAFAGSDTLATSRALAEAVKGEAAFDLILLGHHSLDGETGQVGPEVAELLDLPFASGVRAMEISGEELLLQLEHDDGTDDVSIALPAVLSVAERLCEPCKVPAPQRAEVAVDLIARVTAADLGEGPWGEPGSPTRVGAVRETVHIRSSQLLVGRTEEQVDRALKILHERGALFSNVATGEGLRTQVDPERLTHTSPRDVNVVIGVVAEINRAQMNAELLGAASRLADAKCAWVTSLSPHAIDAPSLAALGADSCVVFAGGANAEDIADGVVEWSKGAKPWAILAPSTAFGGEVAGRVAAALRTGLVGDAIGVEVVDGQLVAAKPAFSGALVADIVCRTLPTLVTVRPGVLPVPHPRVHSAQISSLPLATRGRVQVRSQRRDDDIEVLARAEVVIGVGLGIKPDEYKDLESLAALLHAELAATRKVTDNSWAPRSRQVGVTGRSIAPRLYLAVGLSGKFNHMVGVRSAGTIVAINSDAQAPVFDHCDIGLVGDWRDIVPALESALRCHAQSSFEAAMVE